MGIHQLRPEIGAGRLNGDAVRNDAGNAVGDYATGATVAGVRRVAVGGDDDDVRRRRSSIGVRR